MTVRTQSLQVAFSVVVVYAIDVIHLQLTFPYDSGSACKAQSPISVLAVGLAVATICVKRVFPFPPGHSSFGGLMQFVMSVTACSAHYSTVSTSLAHMLPQLIAARFTTDPFTHTFLLCV